MTLELVRDPPFQHQERPKKLRMVPCARQMLVDQHAHALWFEEASFYDRALVEAGLELAAKLVSEPVRDRRREPSLRPVD
jgi:hypothetical protein